MSRPFRVLPAIVAVAICGCVLSFYGTLDASQRSKAPAQPPFANSVDQRFEMIVHLKEIRDLLKEQNGLLKEQNALLRQTDPQNPKNPNR